MMNITIQLVFFIFLVLKSACYPHRPLQPVSALQCAPIPIEYLSLFTLATYMPIAFICQTLSLMNLLTLDSIHFSLYPNLCGSAPSFVRTQQGELRSEPSRGFISWIEWGTL